MEQLKSLLEIATPCVLVALFIVNMLIKVDQNRNKVDLLTHQKEVQNELNIYNNAIAKTLGTLDTKLEVHIAKDEEYQKGISRTLTRIDDKLEKS